MTVVYEIFQSAPHLPPVAAVGFDCTFPDCPAQYRHPYGQEFAGGWLEAGAVLAGWTGARTDRPRCPEHPYGTPVAELTAPAPTRKKGAKK